MKLFNFLAKKSKNAEPSSEFSRFFLESSSKEKKKVFLYAARKANEEQRKLFYKSSIRTPKTEN